MLYIKGKLCRLFTSKKQFNFMIVVNSKTCSLQMYLLLYCRSQIEKYAPYTSSAKLSQRKTKMAIRLGIILSFNLCLINKLRGCLYIQIVTNFETFDTNTWFGDHMWILWRLLSSDIKHKVIRWMELWITGRGHIA